MTIERINRFMPIIDPLPLLRADAQGRVVLWCEHCRTEYLGPVSPGLQPLPALQRAEARLQELAALVQEWRFSQHNAGCVCKLCKRTAAALPLLPYYPPRWLAEAPAVRYGPPVVAGHDLLAGQLLYLGTDGRAYAYTAGNAMPVSPLGMAPQNIRAGEMFQPLESATVILNEPPADVPAVVEVT